MGKNKRKGKSAGTDIVDCHRCSQSGNRHTCVYSSPSDSAAASASSSSIEQQMQELADSFKTQLTQQQDAHRAEMDELRGQVRQKDSEVETLKQQLGAELSTEKKVADATSVCAQPPHSTRLPLTSVTQPSPVSSQPPLLSNPFFPMSSVQSGFLPQMFTAATGTSSNTAAASAQPSSCVPPPAFGFRPPQMFSSPSPGFGVASGQPAAQWNLPPLPMFSGEQVGENQFTLWELNFSNDMVAAGNPAPFWTRYLWRYLSGAALAAYHEFLATDPDIQYVELVRKFRKRFDRTKTASDYQNEVDRLFWGSQESIEDFGERCSSLFKRLHRCQPDKPANHQNVFLRCMPPHICQILRGHIRVLVDPDAPIELTQLVRWVRRYLDDCDADKALDKERKLNMELAQERFRGSQEGPSFSGGPPPVGPSRPPLPHVGAAAAPSSLLPQTSKAAAPGLQQPSSVLPAGQRPRACFTCGDPGHMRGQCPLQMNRPQGAPFANQVQLFNASSARREKWKEMQPKVPQLSSAGSPELSVSQSPVPLASELPSLTAVSPLVGNHWPPDTAVNATAPTPQAHGRLSADQEMKERLVKKSPSFCAKTMMVLPVRVAETEIDAQIDTGSPVVIINKDVIAMLAEHHGREAFNKMIQPVPKTFTDLQGNVIPLEGMVDVEFELNGARIVCPSMISLKMRSPLIIGLSFFENVGLEMSIPTGDSVVRLVLPPEREVNGEPIQISFGRHRRKTLQEKGECRRQQKRERWRENSKVGLISTAPPVVDPDLSQNRPLRTYLHNRRDAIKPKGGRITVDWDVVPTSFIPVVSSEAPSAGESWRKAQLPLLPQLQPRSSSVVGRDECWRPMSSAAEKAVREEGLVVTSGWRPRGKRAGKKTKNRHRLANG